MTVTTKSYGVIARPERGPKCERRPYQLLASDISRQEAECLRNNSLPLAEAIVGTMEAIRDFMYYRSETDSPGMYYTKGAIMDQLKHALGEDLVFDYALPQSWVDDVYRATGEPHVANFFVWNYPKGSFGGEPLALCTYGQELLNKYNSSNS